MKVGELKKAVRGDIWASGEPENLIEAHDRHFQEAFADIAKWVTLERQDNVDLVRFFKTRYKAGMTVFKAPRNGIVSRIFTVANENYSDPVYYRQTKWPLPEAWARNLYLSPLDLTALPRLPLGFQYADATNDSLYGRARTGIWSLHQGNIYMAPWIQSNELVVVEWSGIKEVWDDGDLINPEIHYQKAVKLYVQFAHERDYGEASRAAQFSNAAHQGWYDLALGDLIHEDNKRTEVQVDTDGVGSGVERNRLCEELSDDIVLPSVVGVTIADVGNISAPGEYLDDVSDMVRGTGPNSVIACGLIAGTVTDYDLTAGEAFHDFISPYGGEFGQGADSPMFWPGASAADWQKDGLISLMEFFKLPGRYYDVVLGDMHVFFLDPNASDPDGIDSASIQATWLQARLALSTAPWKVVKMDACPWGSVYSNSTLQWPFKSWGVDLVICSQAKNYERLEVSGLPVINNGLGGLQPFEEVPVPVPESEIVYAGGVGYGKILANETEFQYEFIAKDQGLIDRLDLSKPPPP